MAIERIPSYKPEGDPEKSKARYEALQKLYPKKKEQNPNEGPVESKPNIKPTESLLEKKVETLEERKERARKLREGDATKLKNKLEELNAKYPDDNIAKKYM